MTRRRSEDSSVELGCISNLNACEEDPPTWMVEGRFNAEGEFEAHDGDDLLCPECGEPGEPTDEATRLIDE